MKKVLLTLILVTVIFVGFTGTATATLWEEPEPKVIKVIK